MAHGVIPGIALAVLWGFSPVVGAFISALVMSGLVTAVSARTTVREDTAIGLLFVGKLGYDLVDKDFRPAANTVLLGFAVLQTLAVGLLADLIVRINRPLRSVPPSDLRELS